MKPGQSFRRVVAALLAAVAALVSVSALAHKASDGYLTLDAAGRVVHGRWDIALRDLANVVDLDADGDGAITWAELRSRQGQVTSYALGHLAVASEASGCPVAPGALRVTSHSDGAYAVLDFDASCSAEPRTLAVAYTLFFDVDPQHRGIVRIDDGVTTKTAIFSPRESLQTFERRTRRRWPELGAAVKLGVQHIFAGVDHICFLVALLLPAVLIRRNGAAWSPVDRFGPAFADVLRIVTSFTVAHSLTLTVTTLGLVHLPSRLVEAGIAASVVVAAVNNVLPLFVAHRWRAAFALGLLHGFGFGASLMDLGLPRQNLALTLFGFNLGVEVGQMCVVAAFVPLAYHARRTWLYRRAGLVGGSLAIAAAGGLWLVERVFAVRLL